MDELSNFLSMLKVDAAYWSIVQLSENSAFEFNDQSSIHCIVALAGDFHLNPQTNTRICGAPQMKAGDVAIAIGGQINTISENPNVIWNLEKEAASTCDDVPWHEIGNSSPRALAIVGSFEIEPLFVKLLSQFLPELYVCQSPDGELPLWTGTLSSAHQLQKQAKVQGVGAFSLRMADMCLTELSRDYLASRHQRGDAHLRFDIRPTIARAVQIIHSRPTLSWTVESLAKEVGMSRSSFASAFGEAIGEGPVAYLSRVRMQTAAKMLRTERMSMMQIAHHVGYSSDISLNRAFRRFFGTSPSEFRKSLLEQSRSLSEGDEFAELPKVASAMPASSIAA